MSEKDKINLNVVIQKDSERKRRRHAEQRQLTFRDYLKLLEDDPLIAQNSPSRLLEMILNQGTEQIPENERWSTDNGDVIDIRYKCFSPHLFSLDKPIFQIVKYLKAGANRLSTGKQILILVGPTASGKSTLASILKHTLENYDTRPVFMIDGCPMFHEPLLLLPRHLRAEFSMQLGVKIEGDLCPPCRHRLETEFGDKDGVIRWWDFPVKSFTFSIQGTRGIGSFEPSDEKSQDVTELVGRENIAISSTKGPDHPLAYSLTGELEKANRGICEGRELIKADKKLLWVFISVAEEKEIKVQGSTFPHISVDTVVLGHTNLTEFKKFANNQDNEALHDRMYVVQVPYHLRIKDEISIYRKLIEQESDFTRISKSHIAPGSLEMAALFAVLTRLAPSQMGVDVLTKAKVYNGDRALTELKDKDKKPIDIRGLMDEGQTSDDISKREGMFGVSSRDVLAAINTALVKTSNGCLTPLTVIRALREVFQHRMGYAPEEVKRFLELLTSSEGGSVLVEYKEFVKKSAKKAFLKTYGDLVKKLREDYVREANFYLDQKNSRFRGHVDVKRDDMSGRPKEPNVKLLRSIEEQMEITESEADTFRGEVARVLLKNPDMTYSILDQACENKLLNELGPVLATILASPKSEEEKKRATDLFSELTERCGFCPICAKEILEKAREFLTE